MLQEAIPHLNKSVMWVLQCSNGQHYCTKLPYLKCAQNCFCSSIGKAHHPYLVLKTFLEALRFCTVYWIYIYISVMCIVNKKRAFDTQMLVTVLTVEHRT